MMLKRRVRTLSPMNTVIPHLWRELDDAVLDSLARGAATPAEIGQRLGMSEAAVASIVAMLAAEGRVRVCRVALA